MHAAELLSATPQGPASFQPTSTSTPRLPSRLRPPALDPLLLQDEAADVSF
jgi:hypothetical protein